MGRTADAYRKRKRERKRACTRYQRVHSDVRTISLTLFYFTKPTVLLSSRTHTLTHSYSPSLFSLSLPFLISFSTLPYLLIPHFSLHNDVPFEPTSFGPEDFVAISNFWCRRWTSFTFLVDNFFHVLSIMDG